MATIATYETAMQYTPYTPADAIEYPKPEIPYCWTPELVVNVTVPQPGPDPN